MSWHDANYRYMTEAVALIRATLESFIERGEVDATADAIMAAQQKVIAAEQELPSPAAIEKLAGSFTLTEFERNVVLFCAAMEIDPSIGILCSEAQRAANRPFPTFSLAMSILSGAHWDAMAPDAPLRQWRLIELLSRESIAAGRLRIDERILHYLLGTRTLDERLTTLMEPFAATLDLLPSHKELAQRGARLLEQTRESAVHPCIQLCGPEQEGKRSIAAWIADWLEVAPWLLRAGDIPADPAEQMELARLWEREAILSRAILILDLGGDESPRAIAAAQSMAEHLRSPLLILARAPFSLGPHPALKLDVARPTLREQRIVWERMLGEKAAMLEEHLDAVISQFNLGIGAARTAANEINGRVLHAGSDISRSLLWEACRSQARPHLEDLATRIESSACWDDLVLPDLQKRTLHDLTAHVRQRMKVYEEWGFGRRGRGLSSTALFAGPSGTGKTLAAEVIAAELRLDLYHIDLSQIVSKYIGETEKNLRRIFDAAEEAGAVLLFDEADALFGKRSEVKDSHDRHANIEVSYLLQRMESYRGLAILTTNMKQALDTAFLRRIRFVVDFPFPDPVHRAEIWSRVIPPAAPTDGIDINRLANLNVSGGSIWNIAVNAAFIAADINEPIRMKHMLQAARTEYLKLEKQLTDAETRGWV